MKKSDTVIVAGAGVMGAGIAQVCAMAGYQVQLYDISHEGLDKGLATIKKNLNKAIQIGKATEKVKSEALDKIQLVGDLSQLKGELLIEAVVEILEVKVNLLMHY